MEGAIEGHPGKAITMKRRQGGSAGIFGAQITQPIGTKLAAFPIGSRQPSLLLFGTMVVFPIGFPAGEPITTPLKGTKPRIQSGETTVKKMVRQK